MPGIGYNIKNKKYVEKMLVMLLASRILNGVLQKCVCLKIKRDFFKKNNNSMNQDEIISIHLLNVEML